MVSGLSPEGAVLLPIRLLRLTYRLNADDKRYVQVSLNTDSTAVSREAPEFQVLGFETSERARKTQHRLADLDVFAVREKQRSEGPSLEVRSTHTEQSDVNTGASAKVAFVRDKNSQELYIQVIDQVTGEVLREVPSVEIRRLAAALKETFGHFLDSFA